MQNALQEQALIQYEAAILSALEEVNNALVAFGQEHIRRQALSEAAQAGQRAVDLAHNQYVVRSGGFSGCAGCAKVAPVGTG